MEVILIHCSERCPGVVVSEEGEEMQLWAAIGWLQSSGLVAGILRSVPRASHLAWLVL